MLKDRDPSLDTLLDLDGVIIGGLAGGHWVKFDVRRVPATPNRPHGIRYSVRPQAFDHVHRAKGDKGDKGVEYPYRDAASLIRYFWTEVDAIPGGR